MCSVLSKIHARRKFSILPTRIKITFTLKRSNHLVVILSYQNRQQVLPSLLPSLKTVTKAVRNKVIVKLAKKQCHLPINEAAHSLVLVTNRRKIWKLLVQNT